MLNIVAVRAMSTIELIGVTITIISIGSPGKNTAVAVMVRFQEHPLFLNF